MVYVETVLRVLPALLRGMWMTIQISVLSILIGLVLGTLLGVLNSERLKKRGLSQLISLYVAVIRGTPIFVQLLIVYFALPEAFGIDLPSFAAGVVTLGLNSTAYLAETIRGGVNGVPPGQWEACDVLGYNRLQTLTYVILPQAFRSILPAITNELATLIKDSSILMYIGVAELLKMSKDIVARELRPMEIYLTAAALYLIVTTILALLTKKFEKRLL